MNLFEPPKTSLARHRYKGKATTIDGFDRLTSDGFDRLTTGKLRTGQESVASTAYERRRWRLPFTVRVSTWQVLSIP